MEKLKNKIDFEDYLKQIHVMKFQSVLDDDLPDHFDNWLIEIDCHHWMLYAERYAAFQRQLEREGIYAELSVMKSVYETMDTGSALVALMNKHVEEDSNATAKVLDKIRGV